MRLTSGLVKVTVETGGSGYSSAPAVTLTGGGGNGAAVAQMAGTVVDAVLVTLPGSGYTAPPTVSFSGGGGGGAAATATVLQYGSTSPVSMFRGRHNDLYGVDGQGRGFRWLGSGPLEPIGVSRPQHAPTVTAQTAAGSKTVRAISIVNGGAGYFEAPDVSFVGGGVTDGSTLHAAARARVAGARVVGMTVDSRGGAYSSPPQIVLSGGLGSGAVLAVGVAGRLEGLDITAVGTGYTLAPACVVGGGVAAVTITAGGTNYDTPPAIGFASVNGGSAQATCSVANGAVNAITITSMWAGYTEPPAITFTHANGSGAAATCALDGLTGARVVIDVDEAREEISNYVIISPGFGAQTTPGVALISATEPGPVTIGSGASVTPVVAYTVTSVTVVDGGTGYATPPAIGFRPLGFGAFAVAGVTGASISAVTVAAGGRYQSPPTAQVEPTEARAIALVSERLEGDYRCAIRYVDSTPDANGGPRVSSISELVTVSIPVGGASLTWTWRNDQAESRVDKIELWRTTADQALVLYRVAVLSKENGVLPRTHTDDLSDDELLDASRADFGIMPIVMPSGQLNARRFEPPVEYASQGCMFQDRAWYGVDSRGERPNSLWHSEIDEPESAPEAYELVIQENTADPDQLVTLVPFGSSLLLLQTRHLYKLQYVAQPVLDGSITLAAQRGALNARCATVYDGVLFAADSYGLYAFDGSQIEPVSAPIDDYWRDGKIDFSKSKYFHVGADRSERVVRLYYCTASDDAHPSRALCYSVVTKAWWEEAYAQPVGAMAEVLAGGRRKPVLGGGGELLTSSATGVDAGDTAISAHARFGNQAFGGSEDRSITVLYKPTGGDLGVSLHYNGSPAARPNAIDVSRGAGWTSVQGSTLATLDMRLDRSPLGPAPGQATARYFGTAGEHSAGADRHVAIGVTMARETAGNTPTLYAITVQGVSGQGAP